MDTLPPPFQKALKTLSGYLPRVLIAVVILLAGYLLALVVRFIVQWMLRRAAEEVRAFIGQVTYYTLVAGAFLWAMAELNIYAAALTTVLGAVTLAVTLSTQDLAKNLVAGVFLLLQRPFRRGDRVTVRNLTGEVTAIDLRTTRLLTEDGRQVIVPNTVMMSDIVIKNP
jgi:small conductance mechanosensitive channel